MQRAPSVGGRRPGHGDVNNDERHDSRRMGSRARRV
jgi:hypothetical protein